MFNTGFVFTPHPPCFPTRFPISYVHVSPDFPFSQVPQPAYPALLDHTAALQVYTFQF